MKAPDFLTRLRRFTSVVIRNVINDQIFFRGTGLAFTTTLAIVPLIMVVFSFGGFDQWGNRVLDAVGEFLLPGGNEAIVSAVRSFTENAGRLSTWGSILFLASAVMLLNAVENHLNSIFRARPHRRPVARFALYIASLLLISFVFAAGFGPVSGMIDAWYRVPAAGQKILGAVLSLMGATLGMTLLFSLLSAARIRLQSALVGSFIGALAFQAAKFGFTFWTANSVRQSVIYGSLVFLPKFLIWQDLAWVIFLVSAEITYAYQIGAGRENPFRYGSPADETELGWRLYLTIARDFVQGLDPPDVRDLAARLSSNESRLTDILIRLEEDNLIRASAGSPPSYLPASDLERINADRVLESVTGWSRQDPMEDSADAAVHIRRGIQQALGGRTVRSFLDDEIPNTGS